MNKLTGKSKDETKTSRKVSLGQLLFVERFFYYVVGMNKHSVEHNVWIS